MEIVLIKSYTDKPWRSPSTYRLIETSLQEKWTVHSINTQNLMTLFGFIRRLQWNHRNKIFVFNIAEYLDEKNRVGFLPSLLDEMEIPHLGSGARSVELGLDKAATKDLLSKHGVPTPSYFVVSSHQSDTSADTKRIGFPMIVKPVGEGGHIGVGEDSIVHDDIGLNKVISRVLEQHHQPALVEEFITGPGMKEFSVGVIDGEVRLFTPIEINFNAMNVNNKILSHEAAQQDLERTKLVLNEKLRSEIINLAEKTFDIVGAKDYSRVDLRMDDSGCYVLEINIMPGLGPHSFLPQAAKNIYGLEYNQLIHKMVKNSIQRQIL